MNPIRKNPDEYRPVITVEIRTLRERRSNKQPIPRRTNGAIGWVAGKCQIAMLETTTMIAKTTTPRHSLHPVAIVFLFAERMIGTSPPFRGPAGGYAPPQLNGHRLLPEARALSTSFVTLDADRGALTLVAGRGRAAWGAGYGVDEEAPPPEP
jgi:hypothetical protein